MFNHRSWVFAGSVGALAVLASAAFRFFAKPHTCPSQQALWFGTPHRHLAILFGDSLTERSFEPSGWGAHMMNVCKRRVDVLPRGFGGYNTRWARILLDELFPRELAANPLLFTTCFFGANDAALPSEAVHVPLGEYEANLRLIVSRLKQVSRVVLLLTPPPVHEQQRIAYQREKYGAKATGILERTTESSGKYAAVVRTVGRELRVVVVDLWTKFQELGPEQWAASLSDGLHFSSVGQEHVGRWVQEALERSGIEAASLRLDYPLATDIDALDPRASFAAYANSEAQQ